MSDETKNPNPSAASAGNPASESAAKPAPAAPAPSTPDAGKDAVAKPEAKSESNVGSKPEAAKSEDKPAARPRRGRAEKPAHSPAAAPPADKPGEKAAPASDSADAAAPEAEKPRGPSFAFADVPVAPVQRKRGKRHVPEAVAYVTATFNNTIVTFADPEGKVIAWATTGSSGFKGARKGTPYAAQIAAESAGRKAQEHGVESVEVRVSGVGSGRDSAVRAINALGIRIGCIRDVTPVPHNGCRPPKRRRV